MKVKLKMKSKMKVKVYVEASDRKSLKVIPKYNQKRKQIKIERK